MDDPKKRKVLILADGMSAGGTERQIVELLRGIRLNCAQINTVFGTLVKGGSLEKEAAFWADELLPIKQSRPLDLTIAWSLIGLVRDFNIDIIHTFGSVSDLAGVIAAKRTGALLINGSIRSARNKLTKRDYISKLFMHFADVIVSNSQAGLEAFGAQDHENTRVIYNGVELERFNHVEKKTFNFKYICMVGNFTSKKDHQALIRAFFEIMKVFPQYHLILIGRGKLEQKCRNLVNSLGLEDKVSIINDCDEPAPYIKGADICVLLSPDGEGISNVIIEYCALSKPVVATNRGGNRELINDGVSGILLKSHSVEEISSVIINLLNDPERMARLGQNGRDLIEEKFTAAIMVDNYFDLYTKSAESRNCF